jgi:NAD(P)-dependent dehydrogenase (short-subunit alcohol dehydrogenase family)
MRILLVGASGTLGSAIFEALEGRHEVVTAGRTSGDVRVDITDTESVSAMYAEVGTVDAVASAAGHVPYAPLEELGRADLLAGASDKLIGQADLVLQGLEHVADGGSFTLVTGVLATDPIRTGAVATMVNGGLDGFVRAAAIELPRGLRINSVSPSVFTESLEKLGHLFPGFPPTDVADAARAFVRSIEGAQTGQVYRV